MDCLTLLEQAKNNGLEVKVDGDKLIVRGPKSQEELAKALLARKAEIIEALSREHQTPTAPSATDAVPGRPCPCCGGVRYWQRRDGGWACATCHPAPIEDVPEAIVLRDLRDTLAKAILELAEAASWPRLPLDQCRTIIGTRHTWVAFTRTADVLTLRLAITRLKERISNETPF